MPAKHWTPPLKWCEQKRRALQKDEKRVQAGYMAYVRFYQLTQNDKKGKTYEHFCTYIRKPPPCPVATIRERCRIPIAKVPFFS